MSEDAKKLLNRYRELYDEWQDQIGNKKELSDNCLLTIALDEAIAYMHLKLADNRKGVES